MTQTANRVFILGGGFGGLYTALRLSELPWQANGVQTAPEIILVDQNDRFLFSPFLYELITGELQSWEIAPLYTDLLATTRIQFRQAAVTGIDLQAQQVQLQDGQPLSYTKLVLALGGETPLEIVPGAQEHAIPFKTLADVDRLSATLQRLEAQPAATKIRVAIIGAGYSGVELACKLADRLGDRGLIRLVELGDQILRNSPEFNRNAATQALNARNVWIDLETSVASIEADQLTLIYKNQTDTLPIDLVLWTVGSKMHPVIQALPLPKNQRGQLTITSTLQVTDHPDLFALGDLADSRDTNGQVIPATAQVAFQQADYVGWNIWASLTGRPLLPFRYQALGEMMTLGKNTATLAGLGLQLEGPLAQVARRLVYLNRLPTIQHQLKVGCNWAIGPLVNLLTKS
jgi:demethylphylloquinone reductase